MSAACLTFDSMLSHIFPTVLNSDIVKILFLALSRKKKEKTRYCSHARPAQFFFFEIRHCTVIHCDAGGVLLIDL